MLTKDLEERIQSLLNEDAEELVEQCIDSADYDFEAPDGETFTADNVRIIYAVASAPELSDVRHENSRTIIEGSCTVTADLEAISFEVVSWKDRIGGYEGSGITKTIEARTTFAIIITENGWQ